MRKQVTRASRLLGGVLGVAIVVCGVGAISAAVAIPGEGAQETQPLLLSSDGRQWGTALQQPVFAGSGRLVPGDSVRGGYWLRNNSAEVAFLTVQLTASGLTEGTNDFVSLAARVDGREFAPVSLNDAGGATVVQGLPVASGATVQLGASATLSLEAPLEMRGQRADLSVRTTLHDSGFAPAPGRCVADGGSKPDPPQTETPDPDPDPEASAPDHPQTETPVVPPGEKHATPQKPQSQPGQEQAGSQGGLAATGMFVGGWLLLAAAMTAGGILLTTRRKRATDE